MRIRSLAWGACAASALGLLISYFYFARCAPGGWLPPDVYVKGCYTDITALYEARGFAKDIWPYGSGADSLEYPLLSGLGMWIISLLTKNGSAGLLQFFRLNICAITAAYVVLVYQLYKSDRKNALLFSLSPAVIGALFINWDLWAMAPFLLALVFLWQERYIASGIFLSLSIFFKFFPIIYLIPITLYLWQKPRERNKFLGSVLATTVAINLPFVIFEFEGWAKFYVFNFQRGVDFGSIWYLISLKGSWISGVNWFVTPLVVILLFVIYWRYRRNLLGSIFMASVIFFTLNKVYSPQYVLWLALVALMFFPKTKIFYGFFALWQGCEFLYQYGIWRHLLTVLNEAGGITSDMYVNITALRIVTLLALTGYAIYLLEDDLIKSRGSKSNV